MSQLHRDSSQNAATSSAETNDRFECSSPPVVTMIPCHKCGHLVPEQNMELHLIRSCEATKPRARRRAPQQQANHSIHSNDNDNDASATTSNDFPSSSRRIIPARNSSPSSGHIDLTTPPGASRLEEERPLFVPVAASMQPSADDSVGSPESDNRRTAPSEHTSSSNADIIDIMDDDDDDSTEKDDDDDSDEEVEEQWTCSRCTLLNSVAARVCDACEAPNPNYTRPADPVRRERLFHGPTDDLLHYDHQFYQNTTMNGSSPASERAAAAAASPTTYLSSGALMGGLLGAAASYAGGRHVASGAFSGAMQGALGGAILHEAFRDSRPESSTPNRAMASTRHGGGGIGDRSSPTHGRRGSRTRNAAPQNYTRQTRRRSDRESNNEQEGRARRQRSRHTTNSPRVRAGRMTTTITTPQGTRVVVNDGMGGEYSMDQFMSTMFIRSLMASPHYGMAGRGGVDGMSYEQLLSRFGDGSENMGASELQITSLPESTVTDVATLPTDSRQCSICLEDFKNGETRKILPCFHNSFHGNCVDKWLRQNGNCPICKFRIRNDEQNDSSANQFDS